MEKFILLTTICVCFFLSYENFQKNRMLKNVYSYVEKDDFEFTTSFQNYIKSI